MIYLIMATVMCCVLGHAAYGEGCEEAATAQYTVGAVSSLVSILMVVYAITH